MASPFQYDTPTGTAWKTRSDQLVRIYVTENSTYIWVCDGCHGQPALPAATPSPKLHADAQAHADKCAAIQA
jgi:hypothetical protein